MRRLLLAVLFVLAATPIFARADQGRSSFGSDINVAEGEDANNIACAFCSVHVHGPVRGNVAVLLGSVKVDEDQSIAGNVAIFGGDLELQRDASVGGNVAIAAGDANLAQDATIRGARSILHSRLWLLLPLTPLFILIGIIWLIVYLVRRNRYPYPVYPNGPRV
jgi:hypothetical protein